MVRKSVLTATLGLRVAASATCRGPSGSARGCLRFVFANLLYPFLVLGLFVTLLWVILFLTHKKSRSAGQIGRRYIAAALPIVALTFRLVTEPASGVLLAKDTSKAGLAVVGLLIGLAFIEGGRYLIQADSSAAIPVYVMALSSLLAFIVY